MKKSLTILLLALLTLTQCVEKPTAPLTALGGKVTDVNGVVIEGAKVTLQKKISITDKKGTYFFDGINAGSYTIKAEKSGYVNKTKSVTVTNGEITNGDIRILEEGEVSHVVFVQGATFQMGSNHGNDGERPIHAVTVNDFYIGKYEVTFAEYYKFCNATGRSKPRDNGWGRGNRPVIGVSWNDAAAYCKWVGGRLPTEAEWEYAARGGILHSAGYKYSGNNNIDDVAWYDGNSGNKTHAVGTKQPNELGIYDMSGNVWEWCNDWYGSDYYSNSPSNNPNGPSIGTNRVLRGGSWHDDAYYCRSANRDRGDPASGYSNVGFRFVQDY